MRRTLTVALLSVPVLAVALDYTDTSLQYRDAPFPRPEAVAISVLTHLGAVGGNPDGTFQPSRTVNRAEFLKIAFLSHPQIVVSLSDAGNCFPDVRTRHWFSPSVCLAKVRGAVRGYPDGLFHPERTVNYAEALKMLGELYGLTEGAPPGSAWYAPYREGAYGAGVGLPGMEQRMETVLTRGQVARLVAAYRAHADGELKQYRTAELGTRTRTLSSSSLAPRSAEREVGSSSSSSLAPRSAGREVGFPARPHQLLTGTLTPIILDGTFTMTGGDAKLTTVRVTLRRQVTSIEKMFLVDEQGEVIGELFLDTFDNTDKKKWVRDFSPSSTLLPAGEPIVLGIRLLLKDLAEGGGAKETFELQNSESFWIYVSGVYSQEGRQLSPSSLHAPVSETVIGRLESMANALEPEGVLDAGTNRRVAAFSFAGATLPGRSLQLTALTFHVEAAQVAATNWRIGGESDLEQKPCGVDSGDRSIVSCSIIPETFRTVGGPLVSLYADVAIIAGVQAPTLQVRFTTRGKLGTDGGSENGDIFWTDGPGAYRWVEEEVELAAGTRWTVR